MVILIIEGDDGSILRKKIYKDPSEAFVVSVSALKMDNSNNIYVTGSYNNHFMAAKLKGSDDTYKFITTTGTDFGIGMEMDLRES